MKRNLGPLSILTAAMILFNSVAAFSQQQVVSVMRDTAAKNEPRKTGPATAEEYRAEMARLGARKSALQKYIATVDPASHDFLITSRSVREIDLQLKDLNDTLQTLSAPPKKLTLAEGAYLGKYRAEIKLKVDPSYAGDIKLTVLDRLGSEIFSRTLSNLMRGVNDYTTIIDLTDGQNIVIASNTDETEASNRLILLGGAAQPKPEPAPRATVAMRTVPFQLRNSPNIAVNGVPQVHGRKVDLSVTVSRSISAIKAEVKDSAGQIVGTVKTYRLTRDSDVVDIDDLELASGQNTISISDAANSADVTDIQVNGGAGAMVAEEDKVSDKHGSLVGLLVGGVVMSQQANNFSQADPFLGFSAGYAHFNAKGPEIHWRVQGIFQVQPKKEEAPKSADATATPTPAASPTPAPSPTPIPFLSSEFKPFLASRKTFDVDMRFWVDFPFPGIIGEENENVRIGPYALVGASTYMDKNELKGDQDVKVEKGAADGAQETELDTERAKIDNDLDHYYEFGAIGNFYRDGGTRDRKLFLQAMVGVGKYEALKNLDTGAKIDDTSKRFIGRLRIFPKFLNLTPNGAANMEPMFGVEINAGTGPDQIKFFTGIASAIKLFR